MLESLVRVDFLHECPRRKRKLFLAFLNRPMKRGVKSSPFNFVFKDICSPFHNLYHLTKLFIFIVRPLSLYIYSRSSAAAFIRRISLQKIAFRESFVRICCYKLLAGGPQDVPSILILSQCTLKSYRYSWMKFVKPKLMVDWFFFLHHTKIERKRFFGWTPVLEKKFHTYVASWKCKG